jgi:hypothetical protein
MKWDNNICLWIAVIGPRLAFDFEVRSQVFDCLCAFQLSRAYPPLKPKFSFKFSNPFFNPDVSTILSCIQISTAELLKQL